MHNIHNLCDSVSVNKEYSDKFEEFWKEYPKKVGKREANRAFKKVTVPVETLLEAIRQQKRSAMWTKENGRFIPNPATWLNQGRWEDQVEETGWRFEDL